MSQQDGRGRPPQQAPPQVASGKGQAPSAGKPAPRGDAAARPASKEVAAAAPAAVPNGTADGPKMSWAARVASAPPAQPAAQQSAPPAPAAAPTTAAAPKPAATQPGPASVQPRAAAPQAAAPMPPSTGVTLPKGVAAVTERQPSIKFGNIDPSEIVPQADKLPAPMPVPVATQQPPAAAPQRAAVPAAKPATQASVVSAPPQQATPPTPAAVVIPPSAAAATSAKPMNFATAAAKAPPPPPPAAAQPAVPSGGAPAPQQQQQQRHGHSGGQQAQGQQPQHAPRGERGQHTNGQHRGGGGGVAYPPGPQQQQYQQQHYSYQFGQAYPVGSPSLAGYAGTWQGGYMQGAGYPMYPPPPQQQYMYQQPQYQQQGMQAGVQQGPRGMSASAAPYTMPGAGGPVATPPKSTPTRERKVLLIENPDTHETFTPDQLAKEAARSEAAKAGPAPTAAGGAKGAAAPAKPSFAAAAAAAPSAAVPKPAPAPEAAPQPAAAAPPAKSAEPSKPATPAAPAAVPAKPSFAAAAAAPPVAPAENARPSSAPKQPQPQQPAQPAAPAAPAAAPPAKPSFAAAAAAAAPAQQPAAEPAKTAAAAAAEKAEKPSAPGSAKAAPAAPAAAAPAAQAPAAPAAPTPTAPAKAAVSAAVPAGPTGVWGKGGNSFKDKLLVPAEEARKKAEEEAARKAEEERKKREAEEQRRRKEEEEAAAKRRAAEAEAAAKKAAAEAEEAVKRAAAEAEAKRKREAEEKKRREEEEARAKKEAEEKKAAEEASKKADAEAAAAKKAQEEAEAAAAAAVAAEAKRRGEEAAAAQAAAAAAAAAAAQEAESKKAAEAEAAAGKGAAQQQQQAADKAQPSGFGAAEAQQRPPSRGAEPAEPANISPFSSADLPKVEGVDEESTGYDDSSGRKRYSRAFLLKTAARCWQLPPGVEDETLKMLGPITPEEAKQRSQMMAGAPSDRMGEGDRWQSGRMPSGRMDGGPMRGGPPQDRMGPSRQQSGRRGGPEGDMWARGQPLPPAPPGMQQYGGGRGGMGPPPGMRGPPGGGYIPSSGPLPALHRTQSAYKVGRTLTDDPEEEKAQKALKALLNKITPDNFDRITKQIVEKINERKKAQTLVGFIDQIFDKALIEITFAQLYANLVATLKPALPDLQEENGEMVNFRRTLLNKCQEEFETGQAAMMAVKEREARKKESGETEEEEGKEEEDAKEEEEVEEGEVQLSEEAKAAKEAKDAAKAAKEAKRAEAKKAEEDRKARRRMLGNIIFVGQLYLTGSLTEGVIHTCIRQLLDETDNPRPEDVECLCKLMATVGGPLDGSTRVVDKGRGATSSDMMDVYFKRIQALMSNPALDSRHRFMLQDLLDMRSARWNTRRKAEGPKTIEEIHKAAAKERDRTAMLDRQQSGRGGDFQRGGPPPQRRGPLFDRTEGPMRAMARVPSGDSLRPEMQSLRPGGRPGPAVGGSFRDRGPGGPRPAAPAAAAAESPQRPQSGAAAQQREREQQQQAAQQASQQAQREAPEEAASAAGAKEEEALDKMKALLLELYSGGDIKEALVCLREVKEGGADMGSAFAGALRTSLEAKGTRWDLLASLLEAAAEQGLLAGAHVEKGAHSLLAELDDITVDVPKAPGQVGEALGVLLAAGCGELKAIAESIRSADMEEPPEGEDTLLVGSGNAAKVLGTVLQKLSAAKGEEAAAAAWKASGHDLRAFLPAPDREDDAALQKLVEKFGLQKLVA